jgi:hypothetical protein
MLSRIEILMGYMRILVGYMRMQLEKRKGGNAEESRVEKIEFLVI